MTESKDKNPRILTQEIMKERARDYAKGESKLEVKGELKGCLAFRLGEEWNLLDMGVVDEVAKLPKLALLPRRPEPILGLANVRGRIILVVDLGEMLTRTKTKVSDQSRLVLLRTGNEVTGFIAEEVVGISKWDTGEAQDSFNIVGDLGAEFIKGLYSKEGKHWIWLNAERVLSEIGQRLTR